MAKNEVNNWLINRWRRVFLHPLFFDRLVYWFLIVVSVSIFWSVDHSERPIPIYLLTGFNLLIALIGLFNTHYSEKTKVLVHLGLFLILITPTFVILLKQADLRLSIFALPASNLLQLGLVSHKLKQRPYGIYNLILLVGLLIPMVSSSVNISPDSIEIQVTLIVIVIAAISFLVVLYIWNKSQAFLLTSEKKLIDRIDSVIQSFSKLLMENDEIDTLLRKVAQRIIPTLELEDCVIYMLNEKGDLLIQKAAYGEKTDDESHEIIDPIEIPVGQGVVGYVAQHGVPQIIHNTAQDERYIQDDAFRYSELAVPIIIEDRVVGVIDSEHTNKHHFNEVHLYLLEIIASLCAAKMIEIQNHAIHKHSVELEIEAKKLKEINQAKSRFIANLSHDLKTPLTLILSPTNELKKLPLDDADRELVELISENGNRLKHIIEELLQLNELAFLAQSAQIKPVDIGLTMHEWAVSFERRCQTFGIRFSIEGEKSLGLLTDKKKLTAIVFNLFDYTLKAVKSGGSISIIFEKNGPDFRFIIKAFNGLKEKDEREAKGYEQKMNLVKDLAEKINAGIYIRQTPQQLAFELVLSLEKPPSTTKKTKKKKNKAAQVTPEHSEKPVVLVIEDHEELRDFIQGSLEQEFICTTAGTGEMGIQLARKLIPDIIITDLMLPGMSGEEVCQTIRSEIQLNHIPIIVLSAKSMTMDRVELYRIGAENYLTKPFDIAELKAIISNTIMQRNSLIEQSKSTFLNNGEASAGDPFSEQLLTVIKENFSDHTFNVENLCSLLKIGRNQLQRRTKKTLDMTPVELIRHVRLKTANDLLADTDLSISEIAYKVGFNNLSYFSRTFKGKFGKLPSELRTKSHEPR